MEQSSFTNKEKIRIEYQISQLTLQDVRDFFNKMIEDGDLKAFFISEEEKVTKEKTERKKVITIEEITILNPVYNIDEHREYLIKFKEQFYLVCFKTRKRFYDAEPLGNCYKYIIRKLCKEFDVTKIKKRKYIESPYELIVPKKAVCAELIARHYKGVGDSIVLDTSGWRPYLKEKGKEYRLFKDELFEKFSNFIKEKISIVS